MKKIFFLLSIVLLGALSCSKEMGISEPLVDEELDAEGPKVEVTFSVPSSIRTKAMAEKPDIQTMHVAVFNAAGKLKEFSEATLTNVAVVNEDTDMEARDTYTVTLTMAKTKRTLHFIANSPVSSLDEFETTTGEANVMNTLISSLADEPSDAYWQRKILPMGITAYTYEGGLLDPDYITGRPMVVATYYASNDEDAEPLDPTDPDEIKTAIRYKYSVGTGTYEVFKGDFICRDGSKVLDDTGYFASVEVSEIVASIPLVRNFARIKVSSPSTYDPNTGLITGRSNFVPVQFTVINTPTLGFVAPYDPEKNDFASAYLDATAHADLKHATIEETGYPGNMPSSAALKEGTDDLISVSAPDPYYYAYERPVPTSSPVTLLVQGYKELEFTDSETPVVELRWFKIELTSTSGEYLPLYRGCVYDMEIDSISGSDGYEDMDMAIANPAVGDISGSTETENLTTISKGGLTLWVEYIGHTHVGDATDIKLRYKLYNSSGTSLSTVTLSLEGYGSAVPAAVTGYTSPVPSTGIGPDEKTGWYETTVSLDATGTATKKSALVVTGTGTVDGVTTTLYRKVVYSVMSKVDFKSVTNDGLVTDVAGDQTTVSAVLPPNLPFSMFPLHIAFESNNNNINPVDDLPVQSGTSFADASKNSFYFVKTVNWSDYDASTGATVTATFKTTKNGAVTGNDATTTKIYVGDVDGFFNPLGTVLYKKAFGVSPTDFIVKGTDDHVDFNILVDTGNASNISWNISNLSDGVEVSSSSGNAAASIRMSFRQNSTREGDADAAVHTHTATVNYSYISDGETVEGHIVVTVKQNPQVPVTQTVTVQDAPFTLSNDATYTIIDSLDPTKTISAGNRNNLPWTNNAYLYIRYGGNTGSIVITPSGVTITGLTFTWYNGNRASSGTVTPEGGAQQNMSDNGARWTGSSTSPLTVRLTSRNGNNNNTMISGISVSYEYYVTGWE